MQPGDARRLGEAEGVRACVERLEDPSQAAAWCASARARGARIGFVPTMGSLHEGHFQLVRRAQAECGTAVVSIFVNPLQFDRARDFELYPRDFAADARALAAHGCALAFTGTLAQFFPEAGAGGPPLRDPGRAALGLEGAQRPGHFAGVATIVARLFELVQPARAYFGEKDYQQTLVVQELARALAGPEIVVCATVREPDGLARSSRNARLTAEGRSIALALSRALRAARAAWQGGERDAEALRAVLRAELEHPRVRVEYASLRDPQQWSEREPHGRMQRAQALIAAWVDEVRLIDTLRLDAREDAREDARLPAPAQHTPTRGT
jgi:pantoate--beta-alanine ligase